AQPHPARDPLADVTGRPARSYAEPAPAPSAEPSTAALDRLTRRIESAEARSTLAITGIDQSVVGLLSRLENAEHNQQALGNHWDNVLGDVQKTYDILNTKISNIETDDAPAKNQAALRSLEEALGKLASHVYEENELVGEETSAIKMRVETGLGELTTRLDTVDQRVDQRLQEASETVTKAVADSQMRVEGTNRHLAERFSGMEAEHSENRAQVEDIQQRLTRAEAGTNEALEHLQSTFNSLDERLESFAASSSSEVTEITNEIREQVDAKFDSLAADMRALVASTRAEMASEIEVAAKSVDSEIIARLESTISAMGARIDASEDLQAQTMEMVGDTVTRVTESVDQRLVAGQNQQTRDIEQIGAQVGRISDSMDQRFAEMTASSISGDDTAELREDMLRFNNAIDARFEQLETHDTSSVDRLSADIEKLADQLNDRVEESEQRSANAIEQVGEQVANVAERLEHRQAQALQDFSEKLDANTKSHEARLSSALTNVSDRLERIQEQSISSISPVQKAIATLAQRIEAIEDFSAPPYIERDGTPEVPQMVSPVKIDTHIENEASVGEEPASAPTDFPATGTLAESISATVMPAASAAIPADEPFEAGYKNWSTPAADAPEETPAAPPTETPSPTSIDLLDEMELNASAPDTAASAEKEHDYFAELPPPVDDGDDEALFDASNETRDSDIFEDEPAPMADVEAEKLEAFDEAANPYAEVEEPADDDGDDYIARARRAARSAAAETAAPVAKKRASKSRPAETTKKSGSNGPAIAAGVALLAVGGAAGFMMFNKDSGPQAVNLSGNQSAATPPATSTTTATATPLLGAAETPAEAPTGLAALNAQINTDDESASVPSTAAIIEADTASEPPVTARQPVPAILETPAPAPVQAAATSSTPVVENTAQPATISTLTLPTIAKISSIADFAENGNPVAQYQLGATKLANGDIAAGVQLIQAAEAQNLAAAQYHLANLHISGEGVAKDPNLAIPLYKAAAEAGNIGAMHNYATLIADTSGGAAEAANWYRRAAEYGLIQAQFNIATMYESGTGVSPSLVEALYWYQLAANAGDQDAAAAVDDLANSGEISTAAIDQVNQRASSWTATQRSPTANGKFSDQPWGSVSSAQVASIQKVLNGLGYSAGVADGAPGAATRAAIRKFQSDDGQTATGEITNDLIESLNITAERSRRS
ncbi:MAG: peptidoglycan-binding protein, partial [Hyphomonadaceae bacterium]